MTDIRTARTWAEIDLDALAHNYRLLRRLSAPRSPACDVPKFLGLVKSNAYGHGAVQISRTLQSLGADMLAVACLAEGIELREAGITLPILCLGQTPPEYARELLEYNITQEVGDLETGEALSAAAVKAGKTLKIHVKLDTGMGRLGFVWTEGWEIAACEAIWTLCALPGLKAEGLFTHFANADGDRDYTVLQERRFAQAVEMLRDNEAAPSFEIYHCAASAAVLNFPWSHSSMIRPGIALYGYVPDPSLEDPGLRPVMTVKSRAAAVRELPAGSKISYGCTAELARDSKIAVLPIGYGDGYPRSLSNRAEVLIQGTPCPVVGRICMDMCMVDVTCLPGVHTGEEVTVYGSGLTQRAAELDGTIVYELLCRISPRVPRIYRTGGAVLP